MTTDRPTNVPETTTTTTDRPTDLRARDDDDYREDYLRANDDNDEEHLRAQRGTTTRTIY